jgi:large subunit ribosomal protein L13
MKKNNSVITTTTIIDAKNQSVGRLASAVAKTLLGKTKVTYQPNFICGDKVKVINVNNIKFTGRKLETKIYRHHSQYLGGLKTKFAKEMTKKQVLEQTVYCMLPNNRLRKQIFKRLTIE